MPPEHGRSRRLLWPAIASVALIAVSIGIFLAESDSLPNNEVHPETPTGVGMEAPLRAEAAATEPGRESMTTSVPDAEGDPFEHLPFLDRDQELAIRWSQVDLDAVREAMPNNVYWDLGMPTSDPAVSRERQEERARWNEAYGRVLSGIASESEIEAYFAQRHRLSADYVEFASHLLDRYGNVLPARDVGLLEFSVKMHRTRLQRMPRRLAEALERKQKQDLLREAWLADEAAFEQALPDGKAPTGGRVAPDGP